MTEEEAASTLAKFLDLSYRRSVLGQRVVPDSVLENDETFEAALRTELSRIQKLGLGANLASRDFASYQHKRAIEGALVELKRRKDAP